MSKRLAPEVVDERLRALSGLHALSLSLLSTRFNRSPLPRRKTLRIEGLVRRSALLEQEARHSKWAFAQPNDIDLYCTASTRFDVGQEFIGAHSGKDEEALAGRALLVGAVREGAPSGDAIERGTRAICTLRVDATIQEWLMRLPTLESWDGKTRLWLWP